MTATGRNQGGLRQRLGVALLALALTPVMAPADPAASDSTTTRVSHAPGSSRTDVAALPSLVWNDARNLVTSRDNQILLGAGLLTTWGAHAADDEIASSDFVTEQKNGNEEGTIDHVFEPGDALGHGALHIGGAVLGYGLGRVFSNRELEELGRDLLRAQILSGPMTLVLKEAVGRERPDGSSKRSFPSGHASSAFAAAAVLQGRYGWKAGLPGYAVAGLVAGSRMNEDKHYLSDVVFGATLGILAGRTVTVEARGERWSVHPAIHRGAPGVRLTWLGSAGIPTTGSKDPPTPPSTHH